MARLRTSHVYSVVLLAAVFLLISSSAFAQRRYEISDFNAEIVITPDSSTDVTENITFHFIGSPWHGVYRDIPIQYQGPGGLNYSYFLNIKSIEEDGRPLKFESSTQRQFRHLKIYVPNADNSSHTVSIRYVISNALRFFPDHDEFYWNITGNYWEVPILHASAHIVFPENIQNLRTKVFTGALGSRAHDATVNIVGSGVDVQTDATLAPREGLTIAIACDKGVLHEPTKLQLFLLYLRSNWPLIIPVLVFPLMFWWWWTRGRDPALRPIAAQYQPPEQLSPGEIGTLIDNSVDMRDITATIVDLAVRGYLVIEERDVSHLLGLTHSKEYFFHLKKPIADWAGLKPHEQQLLGGVFDQGIVEETVSLTSLKNKFYTNISPMKSQIFMNLVGRGYYTKRPDSVRSSYVGFAIIAGILLIWGGISYAKSSGMQPLSFIFAGLLTAAIICGFGWFMSARTVTGARALEQLLGFKDFLEHVESDRFNRMIKTPQMFEKFLPFAMALGVEKNWSKAFQGILTEPPQWYQGSASFGPTFYPSSFVGNLSSMSSQAGDIMSSAPTSSGSSGFGDGGGGGSSGGGGGGGGGGAF
jgi:uncharacterized membrane protein YgcG